MKRILFLATIAAMAAGCTSKESPDSPVPEPETITLRVGNPSAPDTKVAYRQKDADKFYMGLSADWENGDAIYVFDRNGNATKFDFAGKDAEGVALFSGAPNPAIAEGDPITAVLLNQAVTTSSYSNSSKSVTVNLRSQKGTLQDALDHTLMYGEGTYSASDGLDITFSCKTSIVEFKLSLPETVTNETVTQFYLSSGQTGAKTYRNLLSVAVAGDGKGSVTPGLVSGSDGDILIASPNTVAVEDHEITVYLAVCPIDLQRAIIQCQPNAAAEERYVWRVAGSSALSINEGEAYTVTRTLPKFALSGTHIRGDEAYSAVFNLPESCLSGVTLEKTMASDWLDITADASSITIEAQANTGGYPRQNQITFDIYGYKYRYNYTQISIDSMIGDWKMEVFQKFTGTISSTGKYVYTMAGNTGNQQIVSGGNYPFQTLTLARLDGETAITAATASGNVWKTKTHTNNMTIEGLSDTGLLAKAEFKHDETRATLGIFLMQPFVRAGNTSTGVKLTGNGFSSYYGYLLPELISTTGSWALTFATLGSDNRYWYEGSISVNGNTTTIRWLANSVDGRHNLSTSTSYNVGGLMVNAYNSTSPSYTSLIRNVSGTATTAGDNKYNAAYQYVYQGDIILSRTGSATDGGGITGIGFTEK